MNTYTYKNTRGTENQMKKKVDQLEIKEESRSSRPQNWYTYKNTRGTENQMKKKVDQLEIKEESRSSRPQNWDQ